MTKPEGVPSPEEKDKDEGPEILPFLEKIDPFEKQRSEVFDTLSEKYVKTPDIGDDLRKPIEQILHVNQSRGYEAFAIDYFKKHEGEIRERMKAMAKEKGIIPREPSDEKKFGFLTAKESEGGMGIDVKQVIEREYPKSAKKFEQIEILLADIRKNPPPPETSGLLLNYLQNNIEIQKKKIIEMAESADRGEVIQLSAIDAMPGGRESEIEKMVLLQKEIIERTTGRDLNQDAEDKIEESNFLSKEEYVNSELLPRMIKSIEVEEERISRERMAMGMSTAERRTFKGDENRFIEHITKQGESFGLSRDESFALQADGYKLQDANETSLRVAWHIVKGVFTRPIKTFRGVTGGGGFVDVGEKGIISRKELQENAKNIKEKKDIDIKDRAVETLQNKWQEKHDSRIKEEIARSVEELAKYPEKAIGGVEALYKKARERIVGEYIKERAEKNPKTSEQMEDLKKELNEGGEEKNINKFIADVLPNDEGKFKSRFKGFTFWGKKTNNINFGIMRKFMVEDWGIKVEKDDIKSVVTEEKYNKIFMERTGLFDLLLEIMGSAHKRLEVEKRAKEKKPKTRKAA